MNIYTVSKYDFVIIFVCLGILMFVSSMITAEIQKKKNKFKYGIFNLIYIIGFIFIIIFASKFDLGYIFNLIIYILGVVILGKDIISFVIKKKYSNERHRSVKIKSYWNIGIVLCLINILISKIYTQQFQAVEIYFIVIFLIDLPISYLLNEHLNFYESGIAISTFSFPNKIIPYDQIMSYNDIENINFNEYQKNRFILNIKIKNYKGKSSYEYMINKESKEEFLLFIKDYIEENRITQEG